MPAVPSSPRSRSFETGELSEVRQGIGKRGDGLAFAIVGTNGKPRDIIVIKRVSPELDEEAIRTVGKWRFHPGTLAGKSVAVEVSEEVTFTLN